MLADGLDGGSGGDVLLLSITKFVGKISSAIFPSVIISLVTERVGLTIRPNINAIVIKIKNCFFTRMFMLSPM